MEALSTRALQYACRRVEDFALVNKIRDGDEKEEALDIWLEGIGLDESLKLEFAAWVTRFAGPDADFGAIMTGLVVGLFINQFYAENPREDD